MNNTEIDITELSWSIIRQIVRNYMKEIERIGAKDELDDEDGCVCAIAYCHANVCRLDLTRMYQDSSGKECSISIIHDVTHIYHHLQPGMTEFPDLWWPRYALPESEQIQAAA